MLRIDYKRDFLKTISKIKDEGLKAKIRRQIEKAIQYPEIGKPMRHNRKGTRELYIAPYRLAYAHIKSEDRIIFLELYHKDEQ